MDRSRLEAFSDGVFAVTITLLALNLTVAGPGRRHPKLTDQLGAHWPSFVAYLIAPPRPQGTPPAPESPGDSAPST
jgi:uncharacterized membrane protein